MKYIDIDGKYYEETSKQDELLDWMYNHTAGRIVLRILINPWVSKAGGYLLSRRISCAFIKPFIKSNHIRMSEYETCNYKSYNDFFIRKIIPEKRPIAEEHDTLISPCDGKVSAYSIDEKLNFKVKHTWYNIKTLLRNPELSKLYKGGSCVIIRLTVDDYHRYCYADDGYQKKTTFISGVLHTVNPVANDFVPVFKENSREYTTLYTKHFGIITQIEVGALMVGKIKNHHNEIAVFQKGDEKGYFEFGGSTIILLIENNCVDILPSLFNNTKLGYETIIRRGEPLGKRYLHLSDFETEK